MNAQTNETRLISDDELDTVAGGMMNNGQGRPDQVEHHVGGPSNDNWGLIFFGMTALAVGMPMIP